MAKEEYDYTGQYYADVNVRIRDIEERNRVLKDRLVLIGDNLVEIRERLNGELIEIKKELQEMKQTIGRLKTFFESFSNEISNFARKEDLDLLKKQAKMFQPLEFVRKSDLERLRM